MKIKSEQDVYEIFPVRDGGVYWLNIVKNQELLEGINIDANNIVAFIRELKEFLVRMV